MARPRIKIDWKAFDKLCFLQCTLDEIASFFDCTDTTIETVVRREKHMRFLEYHAQKAQGGKIAIRRKQFQVAQKGNIAMLIWLGKQWLAQSDKQDVNHSGQVAVKGYVNVSPTDWSNAQATANGNNGHGRISEDTVHPPVPSAPVAD